MKFKKLIQTVISAALSLTLAISSCPMEQVFAAANEKRPYIVVPKDGYMQTIRNKYLDRLSETVTTVLDHVSEKILLLDLTSFEAWTLEYLTGVAAVAEDIDVVAFTDGSSGETTVEWNMQMIHADTVPQEVSGEKVKVAIIDSGIDDTPDITVQERKNFVPGEEEVYACFDDATGHGTSIAGIIAATGEENGVAGINPNVELYSAKIFDFDMAAPVSRVIEAIYWAIEKDVDIINLSFGTPQNNAALYQAIKDAYAVGILIVAAAGNDGTVEYPAAYPEVMAVGSVNSMGESAEATAEGSALEITAPGELIASTSHFGGIGVASGTSLAAPHVVGVASVLWQKDLSKSNEFIRTVLCASANASDETDYGYGTVDLAYALEVYEQLKDTEIAASVPADVDAVIEDNAIEENADAMETIENDYVEGRWSADKHEELAGEGSHFPEDYAYLIDYVKMGTRVNDYAIAGMVANPMFHGFLYKYGDKTSTYNNVLSYLCLVDIAQEIYDSTVTHTQYTTVADYVASNNSLVYGYSNMKSALQTQLTSSGVTNADGNAFTTWQTVFNHYQTRYDLTQNSSGNVSVTAARLCAVIYGMAAHQVADMFAHSTYTLINGSYTYISHSADSDGDGTVDADDTDYVGNRWDCARVAVSNVVYHYYSSNSSKKTDGSLSDFDVSSVYDGSFKLLFFARSVKQIDPSFYNSNSFVTSISYGATT